MNFNKIRSPATLLLCLSFIWIQGCATIMTGTKESVSIRTKPTHAKFTILRNGQEIHSGTTPEIVQLKKRGKYSIRIEKEGYDPIVTPIRKRVSAWYVLGNLVFGGLIGYIIVDPISGAMFTFPEKNTSFTLNKSISKLNSDEKGLVILSMDQIPLEERANLVPLKMDTSNL